MGYQREGRQPYTEEAFRQMFAMLRPGGTLGVVDHRLPESADAERERTSGYIKVSTVRRMAEAAGFRFVGASEINANPRDTADYPDGVWTLPPALRRGDVERARYLAIGESDRMTLRFVRPRELGSAPSWSSFCLSAASSALQRVEVGLARLGLAGSAFALPGRGRSRRR